MRLLVKDHEENKPKEPVMPEKEEAKFSFVMKKYETELKQYYLSVADWTDADLSGLWLGV
jgi:hypothetical protein